MIPVPRSDCATYGVQSLTPHAKYSGGVTVSAASQMTGQDDGQGCIEAGQGDHGAEYPDNGTPLDRSAPKRREDRDQKPRGTQVSRSRREARSHSP